MSDVRRQRGSCLGVLLLFVLIGSGCGREYAVTEQRVALPLGETTVDVVVHTAAAPGLTYLNLHDNENTAVEAALAVIRRDGGRLIELQHTGDRNLGFTLGEQTYTVDPNRIFTDPGAAESLRAEGRYADTALTAVRAFADTLGALVRTEGNLVVTVHNNTQGDYSVLSYTGDGDLEAAARFVHVAADVDPDDFFFITVPELYNEMRDAGFNVVLQEDAQLVDDGSLSVYYDAQGWPYINVEAQHGHFEAQVEMLSFVTRLLRAQGR